MRGKLSGLEGKVSLRQQYDELSDDDSPTFWTAAVSEVGGDWSAGTWSCAQPMSLLHMLLAFGRLTMGFVFRGDIEGTFTATRERGLVADEEEALRKSAAQDLASLYAGSAPA